jgi:large subunit ribosomal protein L3
MLGLMGEKLGMTQVYDDKGAVHPVTVIRTGPCTVVQVKTKESDGYDAVQVGFGTPKPKRVSKPRRGHFEKHGVGLFRHVKEFRTERAGEFKVGQTIAAEHLFQTGDTIDVQGTTKGRGFQGVMKRHNKHGGPASHGSKTHRRPGSIGMCAWPGRVFKNMKLPGQMGVRNVTTRNLKVVEVRSEEGLVIVSGSVPGWRNGLVTIINRTPGCEERPELAAETAPAAEASAETIAEASDEAASEGKE